ncbi:MAG: endosialidase [Lachnospiraceae bacterium]|nr:endosialidase [Lachnospiraceae bacterium]MBQ2453522.1 endosialidase [Lachnospiraceae bacterium]MBQ5534434.1 endosialidase [Lachnospiraceae bacterium]
MAAELIRNEADGTLSFGDYTLSEKKKQEDFKAGGVSYKVKTFKEITRLEGDGDLVYESVPGTNVTGLKRTASGLVFEAEGGDDAQITVGVEPETSYDVKVGGTSIGVISSNLGGKLSFGLELQDLGKVAVEVSKA